VNAAKVRIGKVTMKGSGMEVHRPDFTKDAEGRAAFLRKAREVIDALGDPVAGWAIMAWLPDGSATVDLAVLDRSCIPSSLVPDFVRNRLLLERAYQFVAEEI